MKKLLCLLTVALVTLLLNGCFGSGSSAAPATLTATPGDGRVKLTWTATPGVDYWLFAATDPSLTAYVWANLPNAQVHQNAASPFYLCGLLDATPYYFADNGRTDGGPGGPSSPTVSATPTNQANFVRGASAVPSTSNLYGVGYASLTTCSNNANSATGSFAVVGASGVIATSTDGTTWTSQTSPVATDLYAVAGYAVNQNNPANPALRWVAVGAGGVSAYSTDGIAWTSPTSGTGTTNNLNGITHGGNFIAVGNSGTILSTTDGITWTAHSSGTPGIDLYGITHGSVYVAVGGNGTILTSLDGNTWTSRTATPATSANLRQVASFGSIVVAAGDGGTIVTSIDSGATWAAQTLSGTPALVGVAAEPHLVANAVIDPLLGFIPYAQFVAVDSAGNAYTSTNGRTWTTTPIATGATSLNSLVSSGFGYVSVGNSGATASAF